MGLGLCSWWCIKSWFLLADEYEYDLIMRPRWGFIGFGFKGVWGTKQVGGSDKGEAETKYKILELGSKGFCCEKIEFEEDLGLGLRLWVMKEAHDK